MTDPKNARRFENAGKASNELYESFNRLSEQVGRYAVEISYALIAANWAVHGTSKGILSNRFATWSIAVAVIYLGLNLFFAWHLTNLLRDRVRYVDANKDRWCEEFGEAESRGSPWPYTESMERLGVWRNWFRIICPVLSTGFFVLSTF